MDDPRPPVLCNYARTRCVRFIYSASILRGPGPFSNNLLAEEGLIGFTGSEATDFMVDLDVWKWFN